MSITKSATSERLAAAQAKYESLREYFPSVADRARALNTTRATIISWDNHWPQRLRTTSFEAIDRAAELCRLVSQRLHDPADVGRWTNTPQPQLSGKTPLEEVRSRGQEAFEDLRALILNHAPPRRSRRQPLPRPDLFLAMVAEDLGHDAAERVREAYEASAEQAAPRRNTLV